MKTRNSVSSLNLDAARYLTLTLTRTRDLRDGKPVWCAYAVPSIRHRRLRRSTHADVVIIGAGISGALIAQSLAEAGFKPLIVDRRKSALLGSTAASTSLLQFELDTPLSVLGRKLGERDAGRVWIASRDAVNELRTRSQKLGIRAAFHSRPSLYLSGDVLNARGLRKEVHLRQRIGLSSEYLDRRALERHFGISRDAALLSHGNAEANPVQLAAGFLTAALKNGAKLYTPHEVVNIQCRARGVDLSTQDGMEIHADNVIFCTGYELAKIVPPSGNSMISTWAIATRPQPEAIWPQRALIWESSEPYLYLRSTQDGRVICGGEDAEFSDPDKRDRLTSLKASRISAKLKRLMPSIDARPVYSWSGTFGANDSGMPTIGEVPGYPHCYAVMGYGGNGITFSMLACKIITAALLKQKLPEGRLFRFK